MSKRFDPRLIPKRPNLKFESALWKVGLSDIAGLDEAGRGALAGPVYAGAVVLGAKENTFRKLKGLRDSKEMTAIAREKWAEKIRGLAKSWALGSASNKEIDQFGIVPATRLAMMRALDALESRAEHLLIDALILPEKAIPQTKLIKGDQRSLSIAAASVLAKVARDEDMYGMDNTFPGYGFGQHKGYGTEMHRRLISEVGPCSIHRLSFRLPSN